MITVLLNVYVFLSNLGLTRRNTLFVFVWLRPVNKWLPFQHVGSCIHTAPFTPFSHTRLLSPLRNLNPTLCLALTRYCFTFKALMWLSIILL